MSLISGSNSLEPPVIGALDLSAVIVENGNLEAEICCGLEIRRACGRRCEPLLAIEKRKTGLCCRFRLAVRLACFKSRDIAEIQAHV